MPVPGFDDPAMASQLAGGNMYFEVDRAVAQKIPRESAVMELGRGGQSTDNRPPAPLMFGHGTATTDEGEVIVKASDSSKGHVSDILNFHGSPAPWILIGILLAAGLLHLEANAKFKGSL